MVTDPLSHTTSAPASRSAAATPGRVPEEEGLQCPGDELVCVEARWEPRQVVSTHRQARRRRPHRRRQGAVSQPRVRARRSPTHRKPRCVWPAARHQTASGPSRGRRGRRTSRGSQIVPRRTRVGIDGLGRAGDDASRPDSTSQDGRQLNRRVDLVMSETRSGRRTTEAGRSRGGPSGPPRPKFKSRKPRAQGLGHSYPRGGANVAPRRSTSVPK